jgi:hypothetical protein
MGAGPFGRSDLARLMRTGAPAEMAEDATALEQVFINSRARQ